MSSLRSNYALYRDTMPLIRSSASICFDAQAKIGTHLADGYKLPYSQNFHRRNMLPSPDAIVLQKHFMEFIFNNNYGKDHHSIINTGE